MVVAVVFRDPLAKHDGKPQRNAQAYKGVDDASYAEARMRPSWRDESGV